MDVNRRFQYLRVLQIKYLTATAGKEKSSVLDEFCGNTGQNRKYVPRKINSSLASKHKKRKKGEQACWVYLKGSLVKIGTIVREPGG